MEDTPSPFSAAAYAVSDGDSSSRVRIELLQHIWPELFEDL